MGLITLYRTTDGMFSRYVIPGKCIIVNPQHMRCTVVILTVCLSVITKSAAYLIYTSKTRYHRVLYGVFKVFVMCLLLKCFVQKFWHHLLITTAFLATKRAPDGQKRQ